jgi:hypothetical protein
MSHFVQTLVLPLKKEEADKFILIAFYLSSCIQKNYPFKKPIWLIAYMLAC